jgi:large subunit ribosomal protein L15
MQLNNLTKTTERSKKRPGRGLGSGKGKTGGRGQKGQKARGKTPAANVGGGLILYKKLPYRRGWGNRKVTPKAVIVKTSELNNLKAKSVVNLESLLENKIISAKQLKNKTVKILSDGGLKVALNIELPVSEKVRLMVEKAGGSIS